MSHSAVLVIGPKTTEELEAVLEPFDENIEVPKYINVTKAQQIESYRTRIAVALANRDKYLAWEAPYGKDSYVRNNQDHVNWILSGAPAEDSLTDDELWDSKIVTDGDEDRDADGNIWSTYNPKAQWDWYALGGRWDGGLTLVDGSEANQVDSLSLLDLKKTGATFAILTPEGEWIERGKMGWWGMVSDATDPEEWSKKWHSIVEKYIDFPAHLVDLHI